MTASEASFARALARLDAARLRRTTPRIAVLQALESVPEHWLSAQNLYRLLVVRRAETSIGTLYRIVNEMVSRRLVLRRVDNNGKRFYRLRPDGRVRHRIVCQETGRLLAETDDVSPDRLASVLRGQGLMLADGPMTVQVRCVKV